MWKRVLSGEIEWKTVNFKWLTAPTKLSPDKQNGRQKSDGDWNSLPKILPVIQRLGNKARTELSKGYHTSYCEVCKIRNVKVHGEKHKLKLH